jgi:hypothetical protein
MPRTARTKTFAALSQRDSLAYAASLPSLLRLPHVLEAEGEAA